MRWARPLLSILMSSSVRREGETGWSSADSRRIARFTINGIEHPVEAAYFTARSMRTGSSLKMVLRGMTGWRRRAWMSFMPPT